MRLGAVLQGQEVGREIADLAVGGGGALLDGLEGHPEPEHPRECLAVGDADLPEPGLRDVRAPFQAAQRDGDLDERFVGVEEVFALGVDQGDAHGHVGEDLLVEDLRALDPQAAQELAAVKSGQEDRGYQRADHQQAHEQGRLAQEVVDGLVERGGGPFEQGGPAGGMHRGVEVHALAQFVHAGGLPGEIAAQLGRGVALAGRVGLEGPGEERVAVLVDDLQTVARRLDAVEPPADALDEQVRAEVAQDAVAGLVADRRHDADHRAPVGGAAVGGRHAEGVVGGFGQVSPGGGIELRGLVRAPGQRRGQDGQRVPGGVGQEQAVDGPPGDKRCSPAIPPG